MTAVDRAKEFIAGLSAAELHQVSTAIGPHLAVVSTLVEVRIESLDAYEEFLSMVVSETLSRFASSRNGQEEVH